MTDMKEPIKHLPYEVNEQSDRHHFYENHWKRTALELLARHAGDVRGWRLLDYGCGRGETMKYAAAAGMIPFGLDADPECVKRAASYGSAEVLDLAHPEGQVPRSSFDVAACFHVLEHVDNPKRVLTMLGESSRHYVLVAVPNLLRIPNLRKPHKQPDKCNNGHLQGWDHAHFQNLAENHCGLRVVEWANDATIVPVASEFLRRFFGNRTVIKWETGIFRRLFPYWGISIIALLKPVRLAD